MSFHASMLNRNDAMFFAEKRILFLGESIHGVSEFNQFRKQIATEYFSANAVMVFEADFSGMLLSHRQGEDAESRLINFPRIMRAREIVDLMSWAIMHAIPALGIDCIPRRRLDDFPPPLRDSRMRAVSSFTNMKRSTDYFQWRDRLMAKNLEKIARGYPDHRLLVMLHNLHIKRHGSQENDRLRVRSVRESLENKLSGQCAAVAQFARAGRALHNDLTPFSFHITDPLAIENYHHGWLSYENIPSGRAAWHHAFERESIPVKEQYDGCIIHRNVSPPRLLKRGAY